MKAFVYFLLFVLIKLINNLDIFLLKIYIPVRKQKWNKFRIIGDVFCLKLFPYIIKIRYPLLLVIHVCYNTIIVPRFN